MINCLSECHTEMASAQSLRSSSGKQIQRYIFIELILKLCKLLTIYVCVLKIHTDSRTVLKQPNSSRVYLGPQPEVQKGPEPYPAGAEQTWHLHRVLASAPTTAARAGKALVSSTVIIQTVNGKALHHKVCSMTKQTCMNYHYKVCSFFAILKNQTI